MSVYQAINKVQAELSHSGLAKNQTNSFDRYNFRGIDDVYNALAPLLAKHGLVVLPRVISRLCDERQSKKGDMMLYVTVEVEFDFVSAEDGSKHTVKTFGEAMDRGDKATNKAMSAAYKYAAFQAFCIPTEGDNDSEAETHELASSLSGVQVDQLMQAISVADSSVGSVCKYYQVQMLSQLSQQQYQQAMDGLKKKAQQGEQA